MREWFIVGCKLLGVYFLYWALTSTLSSIGLLASASEETFPGISKPEIILVSAFSIVAEIGFAIPLIFKTDWIADKVKLTGAIQDSPSARGGSKLQSGITLLGIYIFCTTIGSLAKVYVASRRANIFTEPFAATQPKGLTFSLDFIAPGITLLISLLLIFGSKYIAAFLEKGKVAKTEQSNQGEGE